MAIRYVRCCTPRTTPHLEPQIHVRMLPRLVQRRVKGLDRAEQIYRLARVLGPRPAEPQGAKEELPLFLTMSLSC